MGCPPVSMRQRLNTTYTFPLSSLSILMGSTTNLTARRPQPSTTTHILTSLSNKPHWVSPEAYETICFPTLKLGLRRVRIMELVVPRVAIMVQVYSMSIKECKSAHSFHLRHSYGAILASCLEMRVRVMELH